MLQMETFFLPELEESEPLDSEMLHPTRKREASKQFVSASWSPEEDNLLRTLMKEIPQKKRWVTMSSHFVDKTPQQIMNRWNKVLNPQLIKGNWTKEEDEILTNWVHEHGESGWTKIAAKLPGRIGKQCRERWTNCLKPDIKKTNWTEDEDNLIIKLQAKMGNKWAKMAEFINGRTDNQIKNRWNSVLKKKCLSVLKPNDHKGMPPLDLEFKPFSSDIVSIGMMFDDNQTFVIPQSCDSFCSDWFDDNWMEKDR